MIPQFAYEYGGAFNASITVNEALETSRGRQRGLQDARPAGRACRGPGDAATHTRQRGPPDARGNLS